jgi:tetratricopeptide (TPR) repeat protein
MKRCSFLILLAGIVGTTSAQDGLKLPALSPAATIHQEFSTSAVDITYSRPSARGRKVFGEVVVYGEVWRTGANAATKIKIGEDLSFNGQNIKAGEYSLYTIPEQSEWEVILNKNTGNWGANGYDKADDVARFRVKPQTIADYVNTFTINIANITFNSFDLELIWEKTKVVIPVKANNNDRINAAIDKAINNPALPYQQAATYFLETNQNLETALQYADKAIVQNSKAYYLYNLKARIAQKLGRKELAVKAAQESIDLAKGTPSEQENTRNNQKIINALK